ncbi:hypothetical protein CHGG_01982 [Chaetomium globosum CBS 148.51]|uniref:AMP-dependent synthetase/ligase domain-containing protein n=1 Tax=Chaetomium globosum (strain ATCC 6205 / CBS 148.51 / DSM 1962 / NBRC 6347 / NRRL 1970) TaxID=306901 RepID=Q2HCS2_CHAGB|nr:uncharacterized protein CHGG_01982 [Chaetomium globosum CBS 148.51]EAQ93747.1 hypothetical protein CHGG_01982 [Chaetomium globosum CBS 148.51]
MGPTTPCPFPTVTAAIRHATRNYPASVAAIDLSQADNRREMLYMDLEIRGQQLARRLHTAGVGPENRVPLVVKRSIEMLVGIYAILLCGAQYVPLDGGVVTQAALETVISQSGGGLVVCTKSTQKRLQKTDSDTVRGCRLMCIEDAVETEDEGKLDPIDLATPQSGCYVIYTSGSWNSYSQVASQVPGRGEANFRAGTTGTPKGVDVTHSNVANLLPGKFLAVSAMAEHCAFSMVKLADKWATHGTYYNCCGPTETTIVNTMLRHEPGKQLTIGTPTPNNSVYILDDDLKPVPVGGVGTLWAGGRGVTRGYVGMPEMTATKYRKDPFALDGSMMYNTGDLGRWLESGEIEIMGRKDDQSQGFRIELDGVAHVVAAAPGVQNAYAMLIDGDIHGFLHPADCNSREVMQHLEQVLPYYSRPKHLHGLDHIPLTQNGKIDKAALRTIVMEGHGQDLIMPPGQDTSSYAPSTSTRYNSDQEAGVVHVKEKNSTTSITMASSTTTLDIVKPEEDTTSFDLEADLPNKDRAKFFRNLVHRAFIPYRFLLMLVYLGNIGALVSLYVNGINRPWIGNMVAINLLIAVLIRQDMVINVLYTIFCSVPKSWPLWIRASCAKIYHLGGVHAGAATCSWFWLRRVAVDAEVLSDHAVRLHFGYTVPVNGTFTRLSFRPLIEWHSFATVPAPDPVRGRPAGYSLVVSNAGDWTKACIKKGPQRIWVRGVPTCGVMRIATLFKRVVVVATGSGIGPLLGHIQQPSCATACLWSTKDLVKTYGEELVDAGEEPDSGRGDLGYFGSRTGGYAQLSYNLARSFKAEAVSYIPSSQDNEERDYYGITVPLSL